MTRCAEENPEAPYGCVFVVDQINKADEVYRELNDLLPGKVAIWTTDHDADCKKPTRIEKPAAQFDALPRFGTTPLLSSPHKFFLGAKGHNARGVVRDGRSASVPLRLSMSDRRKWKRLIYCSRRHSGFVRPCKRRHLRRPKEHLDTLLRFMETHNYTPTNRLYRPGIEIDEDAISEQLAWFTRDPKRRDWT